MTKIKRSKKWWAKKAVLEGDLPIGVGTPAPSPQLPESVCGIRVGDVVSWRNDDPALYEVQRIYNTAGGPVLDLVRRPWTYTFDVRFSVNAFEVRRIPWPPAL
jgi:hypothetical protein